MVRHAAWRNTCAPFLTHVAHSMSHPVQGLWIATGSAAFPLTTAIALSRAATGLPPVTALFCFLSAIAPPFPAHPSTVIPLSRRKQRQFRTGIAL
jgi:hypothetical protein